MHGGAVLTVAAYVARTLQIAPDQVQRALELLDQGNTVPFIARYRKEATGGLDEVDLRNIASAAEKYRALVERKTDVLRLIAEQGKLTSELEAAIQAAQTLQEVEDQYRPYRPRRRTRADIARERGLQSLADALLAPQAAWTAIQTLAASAAGNHAELGSVALALAGAADIVAEQIADDPATHAEVRRLTSKYGVLSSKKGAKADTADERAVYATYYDFSQPVRDLRSYQVLAINRGERTAALAVQLQAPESAVLSALNRRWVRTPDAQLAAFLAETVHDAYTRLMAASIEREVRNALTETAEAEAIQVFARNLAGLLMQPPVRGVRVLGIDPGYRTGCKLAVIDETGRLLSTGLMYPHPPHNQQTESAAVIRQLIDQWGVTLVAIGNGTASRETESLVAAVIRDMPQVAYLIVSEAGASVYSASELAREEFPHLDVSYRGTVSIARRVLDPLAELVKIEPKAIGVGQYQHDVNQKELANALTQVVESCVNRVGVHVNTASAALLQYVAGINATLSRRIVDYRNENGPFSCRADLRKVKGLGPKTYEQAAGFLRIPDSTQPLDGTAVHPESYHLAEALLQAAGLTAAALQAEPSARDAIRSLDPVQAAADLAAGVPTVRDIIDALLRPGLDPRSELPPPLFRRDVLSMEDLHPGMRLTGVVANVVDFGAFVDLGLKKAGLIHRSRLDAAQGKPALAKLQHPMDVVHVGQPVVVEVVEVDAVRNRIALALVEA